jgi:hypothetical protein
MATKLKHIYGSIVQILRGTPLCNAPLNPVLNRFTNISLEINHVHVDSLISLDKNSFSRFKSETRSLFSEFKLIIVVDG